MKKNKLFYICLVLLMSIVSLNASAQTTVKGTVVDEAGEPIIGATVQVKGSTTGTITDFDGNYTIAVPAKGQLVVSFIGYISQTITDMKNAAKVVLKEDAQMIEEVVVVGYGTQKKSHLTGSVETVPVEEITDLATNDLTGSLRGLINGVSISSGGNRPGSTSSLTIRGAGDLSAIGVNAQSPLYVIDGFILDSEAFNNLDPNSIENISILKDAAAAVYGARAANGVVLVTTKKGKEGAPQISYSGNFGFTDAVSTPKMLSTYNYGRLWNAVRMADPTETNINQRYDLFQADELEAMKSLNFNLLDDHWKMAVTQQHSVNISGATEKANYYASISYFDQEGNLGKLDYDRWNFRAGVDAKLGKWLKASLQVSGDYGKQNKPLMKVQSTSSDKDYNMLLSHPGYIPEYLNGYPMAAYGLTNGEIAANQNYNYEYLQNSSDYMRSMNSNLYISGALDYDFGWSKILKGLKLRLSYSKAIKTDKNNEFGTQFAVYRLNQRSGSGEHLYTLVPGQEDFYNNTVLADNNFLMGHNNAKISNGTDGGYIQRTMNRSDNYQLNFTVSYAREFGAHSVNGLFSIEKSESEYEDLLGQGTKPYEFSTGQSNSLNTGEGGDTSSTWGRSESASLSYIGRLNYNYADRYLLEFLIRSDASQKFHPNNFWGVFPSLSAGWIMSEEKFMQGIKWLDFFKVRASFGLTGRDNISAWQWMQTYNVAADKGAIFGEDGIAGSHITANNGARTNKDVRWDKSYKGNIGFDFSVLNSRLGFNIDAYYVWDRDMLLSWNASVPQTVGTGSAPLNYGKMDSWGTEISITWRDKIGKDFKYKIQLNTGTSDNKVLLMEWPTSNYYKAIQEGKRTDRGSWGMQCIGMFRSFQDIEEYFKQYNITSYLGLTKDQVRPGMLIYKDIRGSLIEGTKEYNGPDGIIDGLDEVQLSHRSNPYHFSLNLSADYKSLSVSAQLAASWGGYSFVPGSALAPSDGVAANNSLGYRMLEYVNMPSFWNPDDMFVYNDIYDAEGNLLMAANREAYYPNMRFSSVNNKTSTFWRISAARVSLNRLTVAYKLPKSVCKLLSAQSIRVNVTGQNLLSFYNPYPDHFIDPMMSYGVYPALRKFTVGVNVTF